MPLSVLNLVCAFSKLFIRTPPNLFYLYFPKFPQSIIFVYWWSSPLPLDPLPHEQSNPPQPPSPPCSHKFRVIYNFPNSLWIHHGLLCTSLTSSIASFQSIGTPLLSPLTMKTSSNPSYSHKSLYIFNLPKTLLHPQGPRHVPTFPPISPCTFASLITST